MSDDFEIAVPPHQLHDEDFIKSMLLRKVSEKELDHIRLVKRSLDARGRKVVYRLRYSFSKDQFPNKNSKKPAMGLDLMKTEAHIIGAGPAGLFAALKCLDYGIRPIIHERGKDVRARRRDVAVLNRSGRINPESNYCFGEGGAGAYSDGKLYTRSKKRGDVQSILQTLVEFGADKDILIDAHPHIGTNKLPALISNIREYIRQRGGEVRFGSKLTGLCIVRDELKSIAINRNEEVECKHLILATGHSARDVFRLLDKSKVRLEYKPFAIGVRVEHPQSLIDQSQFGTVVRQENVPPASYSLVHQVNGQGVYSFCMCPGGIIAPCSTSDKEIVTNGWSPSKRNNSYANSGIVVQLTAEDFAPYGPDDAFKGVRIQSAVEQRAFEKGGGDMVAPAQRLTDFVNERLSPNLPECSYHPGLRSVRLSDVLPRRIDNVIRQGFRAFDKKIRGFITSEAIVVATESRTSSPIRIPRDPKTLQHPDVKGLYPCGEGAGYAGGIVSAAIDGQRCAESLAIVCGKDRS